MPLKKLWNSLCGRSAEKETTAPETAAQSVAVTGEVSPVAAVSAPVVKASATQQAPAAKKPTVKKQAVREPAAATPVAPAPVATAPPRKAAAPLRRVLSMVSHGQHDALLKMLKRRQPTSVLEIGVGDGSRMPAILASLASEEDPQSLAIKAAVIDEFEMGNGEVAMRDYHRQLSGLLVRPVIFPEPVSRGLLSVSNRLGRMDVVLIDAAVVTDHADALSERLVKVLHETSVVLSNESGKWAERSVATSNRRAA
ncbi:hypothetical protein [Neorhodopirellula lusitana]|uniref:hypothetical protein n=1 Tax=Neorhodopirellula lusitana TaxID=445327 RepID=UPI00384A7209